MGKTILEMVSNGQICAAYGSKYMISICPALEIDKVRFSCVALNTKGKNHNDVYISTEAARIFFEDVDRYIAMKKFEADKSSAYPSAYQFVTGANGNKKLNIGGGNVGIRVQISVPKADGKMDHKMSAIQYSDLQTASFLFKLLTGLVTVPENSFYGKIYKAYWDNASKFNKTAKQDYDEKLDGMYVDTASADADTDIVYDTVSCGSAYEKGDYTIIPVKVNGSETKLGFHKNIVSTLSWFGKYLASVSSKETQLTVHAEPSGSNLIFTSLT